MIIFSGWLYQVVWKNVLRQHFVVLRHSIDAVKSIISQLPSSFLCL